MKKPLSPQETCTIYIRSPVKGSAYRKAQDRLAMEMANLRNLLKAAHIRIPSKPSESNAIFLRASMQKVSKVCKKLIEKGEVVIRSGSSSTRSGEIDDDEEEETISTIVSRRSQKQPGHPRSGDDPPPVWRGLRAQDPGPDYHTEEE